MKTKVKPVNHNNTCLTTSKPKLLQQNCALNKCQKVANYAIRVFPSFICQRAIRVW